MTTISIQPPQVADRPRCPACNKRLSPVMDGTWERVTPPGGGVDYKLIDKKFTGRYHSYGAFCTLRCCESFANAAHRAGYRITQPKKD